MAFYPTEDYQVLTATTKAEIEAKSRQAIADGYELVGHIIYNSDYDQENFPYTQGIIKKTNTDAQYIAQLYNAFASALNSINAHLAQIEQNTDKNA